MFAHDCQHMDCLVARRVYQIKNKISFCDTLTLIKTGVPLQIVIFVKMSLRCMLKDEFAFYDALEN